MLSPLESDALRGIIRPDITFPSDIRGDFFARDIPSFNVSFDFSNIFRGGIADTPVLAPPVFESTGGPAIFVEPPIPPEQLDVPFHQDVFSDIVDLGRGLGSIFAGGGGDAAGGFGVLGDIFRRRTTTAQERVLSGTFFEGDIATAIGNIGGALGGLPTFNTPGAPFQLPGVTPVAGILEGLTGGSIGVAPCPSPGGSQGFPAGACITINDWQQLGGPKGFEVAGVSAGGTLILRKKRRRRRRGGLTKGMMTDVDYLARKLGKPAAETYLNRVL